MKKVISILLAVFVTAQSSCFLSVYAKKDETLITSISHEQGYILYEENFDSLTDGSIPHGWTREEGTTASKIGVKSGALEIDARTSRDNSARILLPEYLNRFGNYMIEADITNLSSKNGSRWNSIMYRIQNNNYPYYQMAVRRGTTAANGVEFAERTTLNAWNVKKTAFFYEDLKESKMYHYTVKAYENKIQECIDNIPVIEDDTNGKYLTGGIGFQVNGSLMRIDNIKVTLLESPFYEMRKAEDKYARVIEADTKIAMAPSVITEISSLEDFEELISKRNAATAILTINKKLQVLGNGSDKVIGTVSSMYESIRAYTIPAFRINDSDTARAISEYLKNNAIEDVFVMSRTPELVKQARENYALIRGIVEFGNVPPNAGTNELISIRDTTNRSLSRIAVIPAEAAAKSNVQYLQQRLITVWIKESMTDDTSDKQLITLHKMITAGTNGIVTGEPEKAGQALSVYNHDTTVIRKPFLIGHRGIPDLAPENTIEGCELAFQLGADTVETDIYPTKAGADRKQYLIAMHDNTIDRTTSGSGKVSDKTLQELQTYIANKQFPVDYPSAKIPTLNQYLEKFTGKDQVIFAELKSINPLTVDLYTKLVRKVGNNANLVTTSSSINHLKRVKAQMPEVSLGYLCSGIDDESDVYGSLRNAMWEAQLLDSVFMPKCTNLGKEFMEVSKHRGMTIWPWTFSNKAAIIKYFKMGTYGLITNSAEVFSGWAYEITPKQNEITMKPDEPVSLKANIKTYGGEIREVIPDVVVLSSDTDIIEVSNNSIRAKNAGEAYVTLRYTARLSDNEGDTYDIYTQPVKIQIEKDAKMSTDTNTPTLTVTMKPTNNPENFPECKEPDKMPPVRNFKDIKGHWAEEHMDNLISKGLITGYQDGTMRPDNYITKEEINKILLGASERASYEKDPGNSSAYITRAEDN